MVGALVVGVPLLIFILTVLGEGSRFKPTSFLPRNNETNIIADPIINVVFPRSVSETDKAHISLLASPTIYGAYVWSPDSKSLSFQLHQELDPSTRYTLTLVAYGSRYEWSFSTASEAPLSPAEQIKIQGSADSHYSSLLDNFNKKYPWYNEIPESNDKYFIIFDGNTNTFLIELYPKSNASPSVDEQVVEFKKESLGILSKIGVDTSRYIFVWKVYPH